LTDWIAQAGANCIIAKVTVPPVIASTQIVTGATGASQVTQRLQLSILSTGLLAGAVADIGETSGLQGGTDRRGSTAVFAISINAGTVQLFSDEGLLATFSYSGYVGSIVAHAIG